MNKTELIFTGTLREAALTNVITDNQIRIMASSYRKRNYRFRIFEMKNNNTIYHRII